MTAHPVGSKRVALWGGYGRRAIRWILPIVVLYFVFKKIDLIELRQNFARTDPKLFFLGLSLAPCLVVIGAFRWRSLLLLSHRCPVPLAFVFRHYWTGLALGFFVPASLGWDAYRVYVGGRRFGSYSRNMAIIIVEKIAALLTCMSIIVILYPLTTVVVHAKVEKIFYFANILLIITILVIAGLFILFRSRLLTQLIEKIERYSAGVLARIASRLKIKTTAITPISIRETAASFAQPKIISIVILSFGIQFVSAVKSQIFFSALGYNLPFIVNLLLAPTLYFIFLLPISFGSLGIREGVYIVLYGLFGVPVEIALLVSFFNLFGMVLNNAIGGLVMFFAGEDKGLNVVK